MSRPCALRFPSRPPHTRTLSPAAPSLWSRALPPGALTSKPPPGGST